MTSKIPTLTRRPERRPEAGHPLPVPGIWAHRELLPYCILAGVGLGAWLWFSLTTRIALEDAFVTFRYARNIASGHGFVYNLGERVLGTTTPLQTLFLAGLGLIAGPERIPVIASLVMPWFGIAAGLLAYSALVRFGVSHAGAIAGGLLYYLHPLVIRTSLGGMETPLVLFLMALSLHFLSRRQPVGATVAVALLALCRIDGLIWGALVLGMTLLSTHRRPLKQALAFGAFIVPWVVFAYLYFTSPIPNTMLAKGTIRPGREHLLFQPEHFHRLLRWYLSGSGFPSDQSLFLVWVALLASGIYAVVRTRRRELLLLPIFPVMYAVLMYCKRAPMYQWYLLPMVLCCLLLGGAGIGQLLTWIASAKRHQALRVAVAVGTAAMVVPAFVGMARDLPRQVRHTRLFQENEWGLRRGVGLWLRSHTAANASVAMEAIGYQGYYSQRRIIDMAGVISPRVVKFKASTGSNGRVFRLITAELRPDYIVLRSFEVDRNHHFNGGKLFETPADRARFSQRYREVRRFVAPHPELAPLVTHLTVFERRVG
ncbi:MAG TPA: hypothetical protein VM221_01585 [Armatimonadota bacterium]|nr:hypothetical protein [Armatimonadota bacterium]